MPLITEPLVSVTFELAATGTSALVVGCAGASEGVSVALCRTETLPLKAGIEIISADTIKIAAATMVIFESTDAVPRGPKAALETLLVNNAPASVFPGWSRTAPTSTMQDIKNIAYKAYSN